MLNEPASAAAELRDDYLVNPHDIDFVKGTTMAALNGSAAALRPRMEALP